MNRIEEKKKYEIKEKHKEAGKENAKISNTD